MNADLSLLRGRRVCVALSGGGDSVALLFYLKENAKNNGISLSALNVEHGIRGESSRADTDFVRSLCTREGIPLSLFSADIPALARLSGRGTEEEARLFRLKAFLQVLAEGEAEIVATAHHAGDNAESVLFNLFRGCALSGAGGIRAFIPAEELAARFLPADAERLAPALSGKGVARPFLGVTKAEISAYLARNGVAWREDESNSDPSYTRNFLRGGVLAPAREKFPALDKALYSFSRAAREDDEYLYSLARRYYTEGEVCFIDAAAPRPLFLRACALALRRFGVEKDYTSANFEEAYSLVFAENGKTVCLPQGVLAAREYGRVAVFRPAEKPAEEYPFGEGAFAFGSGVLLVLRTDTPVFGQKDTLTIDVAKLPEGCVLRTRREGDVFTKFGGGTKKLKEFLADKKIPRRERDGLPVLARGSEVFAVCGAEISEKVRVGENASPCILKFIRKGET